MLEGWGNDRGGEKYACLYESSLSVADTLSNIESNA